MNHQKTPRSAKPRIPAERLGGRRVLAVILSLTRRGGLRWQRAFPIGDVWAADWKAKGRRLVLDYAHDGAELRITDARTDSGIVLSGIPPLTPLVRLIRSRDPDEQKRAKDLKKEQRTREAAARRAQREVRAEVKHLLRKP